MLYTVPISFALANEYVKKHHRHHKPTQGCKFVVAITDGLSTRGVAIVGRPIARMSDNGFTLEVTRCCTDGVRNGCSLLYGTARRVSKDLGYRRLITYTLPDEGGSSLRASGFKEIGLRGGGNWNVPSRQREDSHLQMKKILWEIILDPTAPTP